MLAQKLAKPWAFMTSYVWAQVYPSLASYLTIKYSYGRIYGTHIADSPHFLQDILRKEWGFDGIVMSDWYGLLPILRP